MKAFNTASRDFLIARMLQKGFPIVFTDWIKACIFNVNYSICVNGALKGFFLSKIGLRQGCPLNPYLFCIIMDSFSCLLDDHTTAEGFIGMSMNEFYLSHLLYADDLIVFGEANDSNCIKLNNVMKTFTNSTGLHLNSQKVWSCFPNTLPMPLVLPNTLMSPILLLNSRIWVSPYRLED